MWFENNYRRIFLDMHIADWNEEFLANVNPKALVELLRDAGTQQIVVKCRTHTGLAHYPTEIGRMHRGLKGRDYVGEMIKYCHENDIAVMAYFSQIFDNWAYENHPAWRLINWEGKTSREYEEYENDNLFRRGRYGIVCPNNEGYRAYVSECLKEITTKYQFETIFLDMPFWSEVCYCPSCREKYYKATGLEYPRMIDWANPDFRHWQELREEWMGEFAKLSTAAVKSIRPEVTIEHNMAAVTAPWIKGTTDLVGDACDYVGGDLFGGYLQQTFICKYYKNLSKALPFVYMTSRCDPSLDYHTTTKTEEELLLHAITALVHNGAFSIVDGANPDGTLCEDVYKGIVKRVFSATEPYEKYVSGDLIHNVAIWLASRSKYDWKDNGRSINMEAYRDSPVNEYLNNPLCMGGIMREENIPFEVIPSRKLKEYDGRLLIISNVLNIRDEEMNDIENFVQNGGNLYVSGHLGNKRLAELLEAECCGMTEYNVAYMNPTDSGKRFFSDFNEKSPMAVQSRQEILKLRGEYELLAAITLPYTMTGTKDFSAIHSNPPGIHTDMPAAFMKKVGKGKILWVSAPIESSRPYMSRKVISRMVRELCEELPFTSNAPAFVEILGWKKEGKCYFAAINQQESAPIAPMFNIEITLPYEIKSATMLETGEALEVTVQDKKSVIHLPELNIFQMFTVE
ncbi:alpha-L-fucosidase [Lachnospiraceae bacterium ZAX-1]